MDGLLLVDKPAGWTSHDAVAYIRRVLGEKRAGHTGTLDPDATGLLLVLTGKATRLARYYGEDDKEYLAVMRLGSETDTEDAAGRIVRECPVPDLTKEDVETAFGRFVGEIDQVPPMYSAVKQGGRPLYKHARAGVEIVRKPKKVFVRSLELLEFEDALVTFKTACSKGTFVRTLCKAIGEALGSCAHLHGLRRTAVGHYRVEDALALAGRPSKEGIESRLIGLDSILPQVPATVVSARAARGIKDGRRPGRDEIISGPQELPKGRPVRVLDETGGLVAMAEFAGEGESPLLLKVVLI